MGPARNVRVATSQMRRPRASKRRHSAPAPARRPRTRRRWRQRRPARPATTRRPSGSGTAGRGAPGRRDRSAPRRRHGRVRERSGSVSSDGPRSKRNPSRSRVASLPPVTGRRSHTTTRRPAAASRAATPSPPTPAPMTTTSTRSATTQGQAPRRQHPEPAGSGDERVAEEGGEPDGLHDAHARVLGHQAAVVARWAAAAPRGRP